MSVWMLLVSCVRTFVVSVAEVEVEVGPWFGTAGELGREGKCWRMYLFGFPELGGFFFPDPACRVCVSKDMMEVVVARDVE